MIAVLVELFWMRYGMECGCYWMLKLQYLLTKTGIVLILLNFFTSAIASYI